MKTKKNTKAKKQTRVRKPDFKLAVGVVKGGKYLFTHEERRLEDGADASKVIDEILTRAREKLVNLRGKGLREVIISVKG